MSESLEGRCAGLPWEAIAGSLDARGYATTGPLLDAADCAALVDLYGDAFSRHAPLSNGEIRVTVRW